MEIIEKDGLDYLENDMHLKIAIGTSVAFEFEVVALANQYPQSDGSIENPDMYQTYRYMGMKNMKIENISYLTRDTKEYFNT